MNSNKPLHLLNWIANVGLVQNPESQMPGLLTLLQRNAIDFIGTVETVSKITSTEITPELNELLQEINIVTELLSVMIERSKTDIGAGPGDYFSTFATGGHQVVHTVEELWSLGKPTQRPITVPNVEEINKIAGGQPFTSAVEDNLPEQKGSVEPTRTVFKTVSDTSVEKNETKSKINIEEGVSLNIRSALKLCSLIENLPTTPPLNVNLIDSIVKQSGKFKVVTYTSAVDATEEIQTLSKSDLLNHIAKNSYHADSRILTSIGRELTQQKEMSFEVVLHELGDDIVFVILSSAGRVRGNFIASRDQLKAYILITSAF